jgi:hypothetical protein
MADPMIAPDCTRAAANQISTTMKTAVKTGEQDRGAPGARDATRQFLYDSLIIRVMQSDRFADLIASLR